MKQRVCLVLLMLLLFCSCIMPATSFAATAYSDVLEDLRQDTDFHVADYPKDSKDYSLQVIQIAESSNDELFLYVYQPSGKFEATCVHLAQEQKPDTADTHEFKLRLLSSSGTLFKYLVQGLTLRNTSVRYYNITSIFREWVKGIDEDTENDNEIGEVSFEVSQLWTAEDKDGSVEYSMSKTVSIDILNPYVGALLYVDALTLYGTGMCYSHYVAFDTDKRMDDLLEASVYYEYKVVNGVIVSGWKDNERVISKDEVGTSDTILHLYDESYEFSRIVKTEDFLENEKNLTDSEKKEIVGTKWILRFLETPYTTLTYGDVPVTSYTKVRNVTILRLKFETDGVVYNMGTIMDKITHPIDDGFPDVPWWVWVLIAMVALIVLAVVVKPVATVLIWIAKILWYIISAPFKFIAWLFRKGGKR